MKKITLIVILSFIFINTTACSNLFDNEAMEVSNKDNTLILVESNYDYEIYADKETKVMYLWMTGYYKGGLTVMLNEDGTPKLYQGN